MAQLGKPVGGAASFFGGIVLVLTPIWPLGAFFVVVGLGLAAFSWTPIASRLPTLSMDRGARGDGFSVRYNPPAGGTRKRLRQEATALAREMHEYLRTQPAPWSESLAGHQATTQRMQAAASEEGKTAIWGEYTQALVDHSNRERQELADKFGGRLQYVLREFVQFGLLEESEVMRIEWFAQSKGWLHEAATKIEALSLRL